MKAICLLATLVCSFISFCAVGNTLREAGNFSAFIFEDFSAPSGDADGSLFVGRDLHINGYSIADGLPPETEGYVLLVGGDINFPVGRIYYGDALISGRKAGIGSAVLDGLAPEQKVVQAPLPIDLAEMRVYLEGLSARLANHKANGQSRFEWGGLHFEGDGQSQWQVFSVDAGQVAKAHTFTVRGIPEGATVVFNILGSSEASLTNKSFADLIPFRHRTLFNFPGAASVDLSGVAVEGTVLAPFAHIHAPHGDANGPVIAASFDGSMHLANNPFEGDLSFINRLPAITSTAPSSVNEREVYRYYPDAFDPDGDVLSWQVLNSPSGLLVDKMTGKIEWRPDDNWADSLKGVNGLCSIPQEPTKQVRGQADILVAMDESGSMGGEQQWLGNIMPVLESLLIEKGVGAQDEKNLYGAVGFRHSSKPRKLSVNNEILVPSAEFGKMTRQFVTSGGTEDGWYATQVLLSEYPLRRESAKNIILVTDEDRDNTNGAISFESLKHEIESRQAILNAVINAGFVCEDGRPALGVDAGGTGYVAEPDGSYSICQNAGFNGVASGATNAHYIRLALETGGAAWNLNYLRQGGHFAQAFTKAFVEIKVKEIISKLPPVAQPDLIVHQVALPAGAQDRPTSDITVTISNRGLATVEAPVMLELFAVTSSGSEIQLGEKQLALSLQSGGRLETEFNAVLLSPEVTALGARVVASGGTDECLVNNNQTMRALVWLQVSDSWGGADTQLFEIGVNNVNDPPVADTPAGEAELNQGDVFSFVPGVSDPDLGDTLVYHLAGAPAGMEINTRTGEVTWDSSSAEPGIYRFELVATDLAGNQAVIAVTVNVAKVPNLPPQITSKPAHTTVEDQAYQYDVEATDPNPKDTLAYSASAGQIDRATGKLSWQPSSADNGWQSPEICRQPLASSSEFLPTVKWHWQASHNMPGYNQVMAAPIVVQTNDDNADGVINGFDIPDVVFPAFAGHRYSNPGIIRVASGLDGRELWPAGSQGPWADPSYGVAAADIDGDGVIEVVAGQTNGDLAVYENDGSLKWRKAAGGRGQVAIADLEGDGRPEIIYAEGVYDANGSRLFAIKPSIAPIVFDADGDGLQEVLSGGALYDLNGKEIWQGPEMQFAGVADFDLDGTPEIVIVGHNQISMLNHDGSYVWGALNVPGSGGGPVTIADFDGDSVPEIGLAAKYYYFVFEADGTVRWRKQTQDRSSQRTGSSVFDFDGDGQAEILYADELHFRVYDGSSGDVIYQIPNPSGTLFEYPLVVDIDNDRQAEIVLAANNYAFPGVTGIRVFEGEGWAPTRNIWNQHSYHINNIEDDGTIPASEAPSWLSHNTYRLNTFASQQVSAVSDLRISDVKYLDGRLDVTVANGGEGASGKGISVELKAVPAAERTIGSWQLPALRAGDSHVISQEIDLSALSRIQLEIDPQGHETECNRFNNTSLIDLVTVTVADDEGAADTQQFSVRTEPLNRSPAATAQPDLELTVNQIWTLSLAATDPDSWDVLTWRLLAAPAAAQFDPVQGIISWKPVLSDVGTHTLQFEVVDTYGMADQVAFVVKVRQENRAPVITSTPPAEVVEGNAWQYQLVASDPDGDSLIYEVMYPAELTVDSHGSVTWRAPVTGTHDVLLRVRDGRGGSAEQAFKLVVSQAQNTPPVITSQPALQIEAGSEYLYKVTASDAEQDMLSYQLARHPAGMTVDQAGVVRWVVPPATQPSSYPVTIVVSDGMLSAEQSFELGVTAKPNTPPVIVSVPLKQAQGGSEYRYQVVGEDADGDTLAYQLVQFPEGMSIDDAGVLKWSVPAGLEGQVPVKVSVSDGRTAVTQQFVISVSGPAPANHSPVIRSAPVLAVSSGTAYQYQIVADDPDGDTLVYSVLASEPGISVSASGLVSWSVPASFAGSVSVELTVSDGMATVGQSYQLLVSNPGSNGKPVFTGIPATEAVRQAEYVTRVNATDPDGDVISYRLIDSPAGMVVDGGGNISWQVPSDAPAQVRVTLQASDGVHYAQRTWTISVKAWGLPLDVVIAADKYRLLVNENALVQIQPSGGKPPYTTTLWVNGQKTPLDNQRATSVHASVPSVIALRALVIDASGTEVTVQDTLSVATGSDTQPPRVTISSPPDGTEISSVVDVLGTVSDDNLAYYTLSVFPKDRPSQIQELARGEKEVTDGTLAVFDPSLLENGMYTLAVVAEDVDGNRHAEGIDILVSGEMKIGDFSFTQRDIDLPMFGFPVTVDRSYDSRRRHLDGDFGYGWSLGVTNVKVDETAVLGEGWSLNKYGSVFSTSYCIEPNGPMPQVRVTLPDGKIERFEAVISPACSKLVPALDVTLSFKAIDGTQSALEPLNHAQLRFQGGNLYDFSTLYEVADPVRYKLTTRSGVEMFIHQGEGLESLASPSGQTLTYTRSGIIHSAGKSITFDRNAEGRITQVTDPAGNQYSYSYDSQGNLRAVTDPLGNKSTFGYNRERALIDLYDPLGRRLVKNIYDGQGRLIAQEDEKGNRTEFNHDLQGRQTQVSDRNGNTTVYFYNDKGKVTSVIDALGQVTQHVYDEKGNKISTVEPDGSTRAATFNARNDQTSVTDALGSVTEFHYNSRGQETEVVDSKGNRYANTYDQAGNLLTVTDPAGNTESNQFDTAGRLVKSTDALGRETNYVYDSSGNKLAETNSAGEVIRFEYDANNNKVAEIRERKHPDGTTELLVTRYIYDKAGQLVQSIDPQGYVTKNVYNELGQKVRHIDPLGQVMSTEYDAYGRESLVTYPDGTTSAKVYDNEGNLLRETGRSGQTTRYIYDGLNRLIRTIYPDGAEIATEYNAAGRPEVEVDAAGNRTRKVYDANGQRIEKVNALGNKTRYEYDSEGNMIAMTDALGRRTEYRYDQLGRQVETLFADGNRLVKQYDALGRVASTVDQAGRETRFEYDHANRLVKVIDSLNNETRYQYDELGNKTRQIDALGRITRWDYDGGGNVISRTLPLGQVESFSYNALNQKVSHTDFNGTESSFTYDAMGRLTEKVTGKGLPEQEIHRYSYDSDGNRVEAVIIDSQQTRTWSYRFDSQGRLLSESKPGGELLSYRYDVNGNKIRQTIGTGAAAEVTGYTYDALNRLASVTDHNGGVTTYSYDAVGNLIKTGLANGLVTTYRYDVLNRLVEQISHDAQGQLVAHYEYSLARSGQRTKLIEHHTGKVITYSYDGAGRLSGEQHTSADGSVSTIGYEYDKVGNRIALTQDGVRQESVYDENDRLISKDGLSLDYDANGNLLGERLSGGQEKRYQYNGSNQLVAAAVNGASVRYSYDPDGIRVQKVSGGQVTDYLVDQNRRYAQVLQEIVDGVTAVSYVYGIDLISQHRSHSDHYYLYDGLGSTRFLTDGQSAISDSYDYDGYGNLLASRGKSDNSYLFAGEQYDKSLEQYYLRARYYDQQAGRFTQMDSWMGRPTEPVTLNKYLYGNADPIRYVDPTGYMAASYTMSGMSLSFSVQSILYSSYAFLAVNAPTIMEGASVLSQAILASVSYSKSTQGIRSRVDTCRKTRGKKCGGLTNVVVIGKDYPESQEHISDAQLGMGSNGIVISPVVTYSKGLNKSRSWLKSTKECKSKPPGTQCDEYPYAPTLEGGKQNYWSNMVSLRPIAGWDNHGSGVKVWARAVRGMDGHQFIIAPQGPVSFFVKNGTFNM